MGNQLRLKLEVGKVPLFFADLCIPEEVKAQLFKPLFTTKSKGQGLGLAVVKRLVEAQGDTVGFESIVGDGAKFKITLLKSVADKQEQVV